METIEQTPEFLALIEADDAAESGDFDAIDERFATRLAEILARIGSGAGKRVLVVDHLDRFQLRTLSRWVGPEGGVELTVGPAGEPEEVDQALSDAPSANCRIVERASAPAGGYDLLVASRTLYWDASGSPERARHLDWLGSRLRPGGAAILVEFDFAGWQFLPAAPALEALNRMVYDAFGYQFSAAESLPEALGSIGVGCSLEATTTVLPAESGLGRRILSRARAFVSTGGFPPETAELIAEAERELADPDRWVLHPTVVFGWGTSGS